jgi:hypothetical protein
MKNEIFFRGRGGEFDETVAIFPVKKNLNERFSEENKDSLVE